MLTFLIQEDQTSATQFWVNLKDVTGQGCWMVGGGTCVYGQLPGGLTPEQIQSVVTVSVTAGGIIMSLSGIYLYYKVSEMYRFSQKRKYEKLRNRDLRIKFVPIPQ